MRGRWIYFCSCIGGIVVWFVIADQIRNKFELENVSSQSLEGVTLILGRTKNWSWCGMGTQTFEFQEGPHHVELRDVSIPPGQSIRVSYFPGDKRGLLVQWTSPTEPSCDNTGKIHRYPMPDYAGWGQRVHLIVDEGIPYLGSESISPLAEVFYTILTFLPNLEL